MKNVYDLEGNYWEWTAEAYSTDGRAGRGGGCYYVPNGFFFPASGRSDSTPTFAFSYYSARTGLYVNL